MADVLDRRKPEGGAVPKRTGRILVPIAEQRRREVAELGQRELAAVLKGCKAELAKNFPLVYGPPLKVAEDGKPFKVKGEPRYFHSGGRTYYPDK